MLLNSLKPVHTGSIKLTSSGTNVICKKEKNGGSIWLGIEGKQLSLLI